MLRRLSEVIWGEEPLLNEVQIKLIRSSWRKVEKGNLQETGLVLFNRLFKIAPYLRDLFPFGYQPDSKDLRVHALGVMETVGVAVDNLDHPSVLRGKLLDLGKVHKPFDLTEKDYQNVGGALLWTLEQGLGDDFTPDTKDAWVAAFRYIKETMKEGAK